MLKDDNDANIRVTFMPLCLAWAITHHKCQGATLDAVELDLGSSIFAYGQAYTALSRCKTLEYIRLINISRKAFRAHPEIIEFYNQHM
jgi:ATP-dependent DNA helicase PIF1